jgi:hypothetical protein
MRTTATIRLRTYATRIAGASRALAGEREKFVEIRAHGAVQNGVFGMAPLVGARSEPCGDSQNSAPEGGDPPIGDFADPSATLPIRGKRPTENAMRFPIQGYSRKHSNTWRDETGGK